MTAWAGDAPARAAAASGAPIDLPEAIGKRDGSGTPGSQPIAAVAGPVGARLARFGLDSRDRVCEAAPVTLPAPGRLRLLAAPWCSAWPWVASPRAVTTTRTAAGDDDEASREEVLAAAKKTLDETSGVKITLSTEDLPNGVTGITVGRRHRRAPVGVRGHLQAQRQRAPGRRRGDRGRRQDLREELPAAPRLDRDRPRRLRRARPGQADGSRRRLLRAARRRRGRQGRRLGARRRGQQGDLHRVHRHHLQRRRRGADPGRGGRLRVHLHDQRRRRAARGRARRAPSTARTRAT